MDDDYFCFFLPVATASECAFEKIMPSHESLWDRKDPLLVTRGKRKLPLTLSHDSEIDVGTAITYLRKYPAEFEKIRKNYEGENVTLEMLKDFIKLNSKDEFHIMSLSRNCQPLTRVQYTKKH